MIDIILHGTLPPSEGALVGTYLESLPDDGSAELGDETTPTVDYSEPNSLSVEIFEFHFGIGRRWSI